MVYGDSISRGDMKASEEHHGHFLLAYLVGQEGRKAVLSNDSLALLLANDREWTRDPRHTRRDSTGYR